MAAKKRNTTATKAAISDRQYEALVRKLRAEKKSIFPKGFVETIERDLTGSGKHAVSRRIALVYLDRPWPELAKDVRDDRELAVTTAHVCDVLGGSIKAYESLLDWLKASQLRMLAAVAQREDMDEVMAEGERDTTYAASPKGSGMSSSRALAHD